MLKMMTVMLSLLALISCSSPPVDRQAVSQPTPVRAEPKAPAAESGDQIAGQTIYVPIYAHIYIRDKSRVINLAATLSIRNTDAQIPIRINSARYCDTHGTLIREHVNEPFRLAPMASTDFVVAEDDTSGGLGANFILMVPPISAHWVKTRARSFHMKIEKPPEKRAAGNGVVVMNETWQRR